MSIIKIDFEKDKLLGFENPKSKQVIDSLVEAIKLDIQLPLFNVFEIEKNVYSLCPKTEIEVNGNKFRDGGHHRSIAYYLTKGKIEVNLIEKPILPCRMLQQGYMDIRDIKIVEDNSEYKKRKERYGNYL